MFTVDVGLTSSSFWSRLLPEKGNNAAEAGLVLKGIEAKVGQLTNEVPSG
jgi:hypothetical protein